MGPKGTCLIILDIIEPRDLLFVPDLKHGVPEASTNRPLHFVNLTVSIIKFIIGH